MSTKQLTQEEAIAFHNEKKWEPMTHRERAVFQMEQDLVCMPFDIFHEAMEKALDRPVWTHEFRERARLRAELAGTLDKATFADVCASLERIANGKPVTVIWDSQS